MPPSDPKNARLGMVPIRLTRMWERDRGVQLLSVRTRL